MRTVISRFAGEFAYLSNLASCPVRLDDEVELSATYPSIEHAFQAAKTLDLEDRERIRRTPSPVMARRLGRKVVLRRDWDACRVEIMWSLIQQKFAQEPFRTKLVATGDEELVEGNLWHDQFWGSCTCPRHLALPGRNMLGRLLMDTRATLRR